ncbi:hypothetical protein PV341_34175 [Streptomyces sp. PA03-1a]|nr:hypothetical protein [Streptomyces sp. PA03-1a]
MYAHFALPTTRATAYTAGLIDGGAAIQMQGDRYKIRISQDAGADGEALCRWLLSVWECGAVISPERPWQGGTQWSWFVAQARGVEHVLTQCLPDLRAARQPATDGLAWARRHLATGRGFRWTPGEDRWLLDHWGKSDEELAADMGRTADAVRHRRLQLPAPQGL